MFGISVFCKGRYPNVTTELKFLIGQSSSGVTFDMRTIAASFVHRAKKRHKGLRTYVAMHRCKFWTRMHEIHTYVHYRRLFIENVCLKMQTFFSKLSEHSISLESTHTPINNHIW